jgi:hypothetical protein
VRIRTLGVIAAIGCAVVALTACNSKIGAAAIVDGHTITETRVSGLVTPTSQPFTPSGATAQIVPKAYALQTLIRTQIFTDQLDSIGVRPTAADELTAANTALQGSSVADQTTVLTGYGFTKSFAEEYIRSEALLEIVQQKNTSDAAVAKAQKFFVAYPVQVNPRYGKWTSSTLTLDAAGPPDFLSSKS